MQFEWDPDKNKSNRLKHGISFEEAVLIFHGPVLTAFDDHHHSETREISFGLLGISVVLAVVHTDRAGIARIISARKSSKNERTLYFDYLSTTLGSD